jgi:hypothetical protein
MECDLVSAKCGYHKGEIKRFTCPATCPNLDLFNYITTRWIKADETAPLMDTLHCSLEEEIPISSSNPSKLDSSTRHE